MSEAKHSKTEHDLLETGERLVVISEASRRDANQSPGERLTKLERHRAVLVEKKKNLEFEIRDLELTRKQKNSEAVNRALNKSDGVRRTMQIEADLGAEKQSKHREIVELDVQLGALNRQIASSNRSLADSSSWTKQHRQAVLVARDQVQLDQLAVLVEIRDSLQQIKAAIAKAGAAP